jgi:hypothetical protein
MIGAVERKMKTLLIAAFVIGLAAPAFADTGSLEDYYPETAKHFVQRLASHMPADQRACFVVEAKKRIPKTARLWKDAVKATSEAMYVCDQ